MSKGIRFVDFVGTAKTIKSGKNLYVVVGPYMWLVKEDKAVLVNFEDIPAEMFTKNLKASIK
jgi:hypothetical protein